MQEARCAPACRALGLSVRTDQLWLHEGEVKAGGRPLAVRPPSHCAQRPCALWRFMTVDPEQIQQKLPVGIFEPRTGHKFSSEYDRSGRNT